MRPATLLARLRDGCVVVKREGDRLVVEEAGAPLPDDLLDEVRAAKAEILALLRREGERLTPCPCGACKEPGAVEHGPCCYCDPCIDLDPELDKHREKSDAEDAAAKADAEYEAAERAAIQAEACTAAELEALKVAKKEEVP